MSNRISGRMIVGLLLMLLGAWFTLGAVNAHRHSVGTPYYAGILGLSIIPGAAYFLGFVFLVWGWVDDGK